MKTTERLARKMHKHNPRFEVNHNPCIEPRRSGPGYQTKLDISAKYCMMHDLICLKHLQAEVANKWGRSQGYVSLLLKRYRKDPQMLKEAVEKLKQQKLKEEKVQATIQDLLNRGCFIGSVELIIREHHISTGALMKPDFVRKQMHKLGLKYAKVKKVLKNSNTEQSLVLR
jgi:transposase